VFKNLYKRIQGPFAEAVAKDVASEVIVNLSNNLALGEKSHPIEPAIVRSLWRERDSWYFRFKGIHLTVTFQGLKLLRVRVNYRFVLDHWRGELTEIWHADVLNRLKQIYRWRMLHIVESDLASIKKHRLCCRCSRSCMTTRYGRNMPPASPITELAPCTYRKDPFLETHRGIGPLFYGRYFGPPPPVGP
jgi:hypothetical protein